MNAEIAKLVSQVECWLFSLYVVCTIGQLHDDVILLQLPESFSLLFSCAN